jgi:hypothetical protein
MSEGQLQEGFVQLTVVPLPAATGDAPVTRVAAAGVTAIVLVTVVLVIKEGFCKAVLASCADPPFAVTDALNACPVPAAPSLATTCATWLAAEELTWASDAAAWPSPCPTTVAGTPI